MPSLVKVCSQWGTPYGKQHNCTGRGCHVVEGHYNDEKGKVVYRDFWYCRNCYNGTAILKAREAIRKEAANE